MLRAAHYERARVSINAQDTSGDGVREYYLTLAIYVFVNIGMVSESYRWWESLPLVSYGGTSILTLFVGFGLLMSVIVIDA